MTSGPDVSAVIVAWNAGDSLASCTESLRESARRAELELQLVVVDNASQDAALGRLRLDAGDVVLQNPVNAGYSVAVAQGIAKARAEWILLVNPDVVVAQSFLPELSDALHAGDDVATLVPELRFAAERDVVNARGLTVDEIGIPAEVDAGARADTAPDESLVLGGSSGCCLLRASALRALGGPEPAFFAYLEDADLALRLARRGYRSLYVPGALAWHEGSASTGGRSPVKAFLVARNRRVLFRLHGPRSVRARLWRCGFELGHALVMSLRGGGTAPWFGRLDALRLRPYLRFLARSRNAAEVPWDANARDIFSRRAGFRETLRRKRAIDRGYGDE
jgi:N-acetylglucosaminyl-diphospho-decaprenol L-rhamnosyltransferase